MIPSFSLYVNRYIAGSVNEWIGDFSAEEELCLPNEADYLDILKRRFPVVYIPRQAASKKYGDMI
jgi:hypothetical protein